MHANAAQPRASRNRHHHPLRWRHGDTKSLVNNKHASVSLCLRGLLNDRGSAAVPFILVLPIFLLIIAILVQYALLVNAKLVLTHTAQLAARAAVTALPEDQPQNVAAAAYMALAPLSPQAGIGVRPEASDVYQAMQNAGIAVAGTYPARYTYAMEATTVSWTPGLPAVDFATSHGQPVDVTVSYRFQLTVPGAMRLIGFDDTVAGVQGRFVNIGATCRAQTSHSRKTSAGGGGWPQ
jgi:Flp pilus assembly protein TadG